MFFDKMLDSKQEIGSIFFSITNFYIYTFSIKSCYL